MIDIANAREYFTVSDEDRPEYKTGQQSLSGSPQLENGYTRIANTLYEALLKAPLSARQIKVFLAIVRKTYGYGKKADRLSIRQISKLTAIKPTHVCTAKRELLSMNMLVQEGTSHGEIGPNKHFGQWNFDIEKAKKITHGGNISNAVFGDKELPTGVKIKLPTGVTEVLPTGVTTKESLKESFKEKKNAREKFKIPEWVQTDVWEDFKAHRKAIKKPLTDLAAKRIVAKLDAFRKEGDCPEDVLNRSIEAGWTTVYFRSERNSKSNGDGRPKNKQGDFYGGGL